MGDADRLNEFDTFIRIEGGGYSELMRYMRGATRPLSFFLGSDNVVTVCPDLAGTNDHDAVGHVCGTADVDRKVGVGRSITADAGMSVKHARERCRLGGTAVGTRFCSDITGSYSDL